MKKNIFVKIIVVLLIVVMLFSIASLTIFAAGKKTGTTKNKTAKSETTDKLIIELQKTVNNLPQKEKNWLKKSEATTIFTGFGSSITAIGALCKSGGSTRNEVCDIVSGISSVVLGFVPGGAAFIPIVNSIAGLCKEDTPDSTEILMNYISEQTEVLLDEMGEIRSDISDLSDELDNSVSEIISATYEALEYEDSKNRVRDFLYATSSNDFSYNELKEYLYSPGGYADKVADYGILSNDDDESNDPENKGESIEYAIGQLYSALTILEGERHAYIDMYENYVYPGTDDYNSVQRDYYVFVNENSDVLDCELPEWKAIEFAKDLYNTYLCAEASRLMCLEYFKQQMIINETTEYTFKDIASGEITLTLAYVDQEIEKYDNPDKHQKIRIQFAKDLLYIINAENSYTLKSSSGSFNTVRNTDESTWGKVFYGQTVYMNKLPDFICEMFDIDPQKFVYTYRIGGGEEIVFNGVLQVPNINEKITVNTYYDGVKFAEQSITFVVNDYNSFSGGSGVGEYYYKGKCIVTEEDPYLIATPEQFVKLIDVKANKDNTRKYYKLINDIDLSGIDFKPIGGSIPFENVFDGNGYSIKNLRLEHEGIVKLESDSIGLFANIGISGIVQNTVLENVLFFGDVVNANCGGIAGVNEGLIFNCHLKNSEIAFDRKSTSFFWMEFFIGGIVGRCSGDAKIENCSIVSSEITSDSTMHLLSASLGGIVGSMFENAKITNVAIDGNSILSVNAPTYIMDEWTYFMGYNSIKSNDNAKNVYIDPNTVIKNKRDNSSRIIGNLELEYIIDKNKLSIDRGGYDVQYDYEYFEYEVYSYNEDNLHIEHIYKTYSCSNRVKGNNSEKACGWTYSEKDGYAIGNISPETKFEDLDYKFKCPNCGAQKSRFIENVDKRVTKQLLTLSATRSDGVKATSCELIGHYGLNTLDSDKVTAKNHTVQVLFMAYFTSDKTDGVILSVDIPITVKTNMLELLVTQTPTKKYENEAGGETVTLDGGKFAVVWEDGTREEISDKLVTIVDGYKITKPSSNGNHKQNIMVTYNGLTAVYSITVECDHNFETKTQNATCAEYGYTQSVCSKCKTIKDVVETQKLPHTKDQAPKDAVSATCTENGYTGDWYCRDCNELLEKGKVIPKSDHEYDLNCACKNCDYKKGHTYKSIENDKYIYYICDTCNYVAEHVEKTNPEDAARIVVSNSYGVVGSDNEITVFIKLFNNPGIAGATFRIEYDKRLEYVRAERGELLLDVSNFEIASADGVIGFYAANADNANGDGNLIKLIFKLPSDAEVLEKYNVSIACSTTQVKNSNTGDVGIVTYDGCITAVTHLPGDVNDDGFVDMLDTVLIAKYKALELLAATNPVEYKEALKAFLENENYNFKLAYADINLDTKVDLSDSIILLQYLAGKNKKELMCSEFEITLNPNNGSLEMDYIIANFYDENATPDPNSQLGLAPGKYPLELADKIPPKREGYRFDGWYLTLDVKDIEKEKIIPGVTVIKYDPNYPKPVLYAHWTRVYEVIYDANQPSEASNNVIHQMSASEFEFDKEFALSKNLYELHGWMFAGWMTGDGHYFADGAKVSNLVSSDKSKITLYAQWVQKVYNITFEVNTPQEAKAHNNRVQEFTLTKDMQNLKYEGMHNFSDVEFYLNGWIFKGWALSKDGVVRYKFENDISKDNVYKLPDVLELDNFDNGETFTLFAVWEPIKYTIEYYANYTKNGEGPFTTSTHTYDHYINLNENTFTNTGYHFVGWDTKPDGSGDVYQGMMTKDLSVINGAVVKLYARWSEKIYYVHYDPNGGNGAMDNSQHNYGLPSALSGNAFTRYGYWFGGWKLTSDGQNAEYDNNATVETLAQKENDIITLYAHWIANEHTVTLGTTGKIITVVYDSEYGINGALPTPVWTGHTFEGWYNGSNKVTSDTIVTTDSDHTLSAKWRENKYYVKYDANGGTGTQMANSTLYYDKSSTLSANTYTAPMGKHFIGWNTKNDGTGTTYLPTDAKIHNLTKTDGATVTLYATWEWNSYVVVYNKNGGTGTQMQNTTLYYSKSSTLRANTYIAPTGKHFEGWNTKADGTGTTYKPTDSKIHNLTATNGETVTLYAKWVPNTYTVTYNANGGTGSTANSSHTFNASGKLSTNGFTRNGYTFAGWATSASGSVAYAGSATVTNVSNTGTDMILYAVWKVNPYEISKYKSGTVSDTDGANTYTVYKSIDSTPFRLSGNVILDWSSETETDMLEHTARNVGTDANGNKRYNNIDITNTAKNIYFIGDSGKTYTNLRLCLSNFKSSQALKLSFTNFKYVSNETAICTWNNNGETANLVNLTIEVRGTSSISTSISGRTAISIPGIINFTGDGAITITGGEGAKGYDGNCADHDGDNGESGGNGGNGGVAVNATTIQVYSGTVNLVGGNGGKGGAGGCCNPNGVWGGVEKGGTGGTGGSGGLATTASSIKIISGTLKATGGDGGQGGDRGGIYGDSYRGSNGEYGKGGSGSSAVTDNCVISDSNKKGVFTVGSNGAEGTGSDCRDH